MKLKKQLGDEILAYCKLNNIEDTSAFLNKLVETGFNLEKYGPSPKQPSEVQIIDGKISPEIQEHIDAKEFIKEQVAQKVMIDLPSDDKVTIKLPNPKPKEDDYDIYDY